ncbi:DNA-processing protein DprA [Desulforhopalus sp. IMCC35007]|uniref:DNA-processing protein DprA n=1 Tax=Desulforhopalus sp. IMCC35007 TaxID=2569543 RepID=UPI0010AEB140|nr:DNA-processing protein DprA [Desulforhopalus sp. IMCC35007]TKB12155.1 DNA-protecting protein DprA [Desulforhopalus sp. IMCC35007]
MSVNDPTLDWLSLSLVPGLGLGGAWRLLARFNEPSAVFSSPPRLLQEVEGIKQSQLKGLLSGKNYHVEGRKELKRLQDFGAHIICYQSPLYPPLLKQLVDPPLVLFVLGDPAKLSQAAVAIVGSRAATAYGRRTAFHLAENLASYALSVVSGLALGIDTEAHRGALQGKGDTVAVLGCGLDIVYPRQNRQLFAEIVKRGAVVSEYLLGTRPEGFRFPARNRIIAGLSAGVVVVEAARKSGSLITAQIALDIGRDVFAVPGQVDSFKSEGAHWLLQQGAKLVMSAADIGEEYGLSPMVKNIMNIPGQESNVDLEPDALALLQIIEPYAQTKEDLILQSGMFPARVSELLLLLELEGVIEMLPGDQVRKI